MFSFGVDFAFAANVSAPQGTSVPGCEETNKCFVPYEVSIPVGGQVTWSNDDTAAHTVTAGSQADGPSGIFDSSLFMAGTTFSHQFNDGGIYPYFCMVHPWMSGIVNVGNYPDSSPSSTETIITVQMNGPSTFYLDVPSQIIRATVEIQNYHPSDGYSFMKVTHLPTNKVLKDFEIYPKPSGNDMWAVQIAYPILESDILVGGQALLGEYEIHIRTEYGSQTATTKFSILETSTQPKTQPMPEIKIVIEAQANKSSYDENQTILVTGSVNDILYGNKISLRVIAPNGNIISIDQAQLDSEGTFSYSLNANNNLFAKNGDYTIQLLYGTDEIKTNVFFSYFGNAPPPKPEPTPKLEPIPKPEEKPESVPIPKTPEQKTPQETLQPKDPLSTQSSESDSIDPYLIIVILLVIVGIVAGIAVSRKKKSKDKEESSISSNTRSKPKKESEDEMKWEGI